MNEEYFYKIAINEAKKAYKKGEIPVGAVIVKNNKVIAKSHNNRQKNHNPLGHAEINCILKAAKYNHDWRLDNGYEMYVTLEPCNMCNVIINECRLLKVNFLISKENNQQILKEQTNVCENFKTEYLTMLKTFFNNLRK